MGTHLSVMAVMLAVVLLVAVLSCGAEPVPKHSPTNGDIGFDGKPMMFNPKDGRLLTPDQRRDVFMDKVKLPTGSYSYVPKKTPPSKEQLNELMYPAVHPNKPKKSIRPRTAGTNILVSAESSRSDLKDYAEAHECGIEDDEIKRWSKSKIMRKIADCVKDHAAPDTANRDAKEATLQAKENERSGLFATVRPEKVEAQPNPQP